MSTRAKRAEIEAAYGHPLQYAIIEGLAYPFALCALETGNLGDDDLLAAVRDGLVRTFPSLGQFPADARYRLEHLAGYRSEIRIERYNRCPTCEQWSPCDVRRQQEDEQELPS